MRKISIKEIIKKIQKGDIFEAQASDGSFEIKINRYVPYVCAAIHDGSNLDVSLKNKCAHSNYERWYEEDPYTGDFISSLPITIIGKDSRFEYDLNRPTESCIHEEAWGKQVWSKPLSAQEKKRATEKHRNFYHVVYALVDKIESLFDGCIVYDIHSYNYKRWDREVPVFNIGTENVDNKKYGKYIEDWKNRLSKISFREVENYTAINDVFFGRGYFLAFITEYFKKTLVLATEVKKIYCDELTGEPYPEEIKYLKSKLKKSILNNVELFAKEQTNWSQKRLDLLDEKLDEAVLKVDKQLYDIVKGFELLYYVNPINLDSEKKNFFKHNCGVNPKFKYSPIKINPHEVKRKLYSINLDEITDIGIHKLYEHSINAFVDRVDLLSSIGKRKFLINSIRYFGRPTEKDIRNAKYLLSLPEISGEGKVSQILGVEDAKKAFEDSFESYGFEGSIAISNKVASEVMVLNQKKQVVIKDGARFSPKELSYLVHHEIGVHMVTTNNSTRQPLKIFNLGLPVNTYTQEGLAVLAEYLSGNITMKRLRELGLRVIAVDMMCNGADFKSTFRHLVDYYEEDEDDAFQVVARVFRGGGFTKDFLYLSGFAEIHRLWKSGYDLTPLLVGKTSVKYYNIIQEMMERKLINRPEYITDALAHPQIDKNNPIFEYILSGLK